MAFFEVTSRELRNKAENLRGLNGQFRAKCNDMLRSCLKLPPDMKRQKQEMQKLQHRAVTSTSFCK